MIKFGRKRTKSNLIDVIFKEQSTSSLQCSFSFSNNNWYVIDSDGIKKSLNGTWCLVDEFTLLKDYIYIRFCSTILKIEYVENNENAEN